MPLDRGNSDDERSDDENESAESKNSRFRKVDKERRKELDEELTEGVADMVEGLEENEEFSDKNSNSLDDMLRIDGGSDTENNSVKQNGTEDSDSTEQSESTEDSDGTEDNESTEGSEDTEDSESTEGSESEDVVKIADKRTNYAENPFESVSLGPGEDYQAHPDDFKDVDEIDSFEFPDKIKVNSGFISEDAHLDGKDRMRVFVDGNESLVVMVFEAYRDSHYTDDKISYNTRLIDSEEDDKTPKVSIFVADFRDPLWYLDCLGVETDLDELDDDELDDDDLDLDDLHEDEHECKLTNEMTGGVKMYTIQKNWWKTANNMKDAQAKAGAVDIPNEKWAHMCRCLNWDKIDLYLNSFQDNGFPIELIQSVESVRQINVGGESEVKIDIDRFDGFHLSRTETIEMDADDFHATTGTTNPEINAALSHYGGGTGISWGSWRLMEQFLTDIAEVENVKSEEPEKVKAAAVTSEIRRNASLVADEKAFTLTEEHALVSEYEGEIVALVKSSVMKEKAQSARISISKLSKELQAGSRLTGPTCQKRIDGTVSRVWPFKISALAKSVDDIAGLEQSDIDEEELIDAGVNPSGDTSGNTSGDGGGSGDTIDPYGGE